MEATRMFRRGFAVLVSIVSLVAVVLGQTIKNKGTWNNNSGSSVTVNTFQNYNGTGGTLKNAGLITVNTTLDNNNATSLVENFITATAGTIDLSGSGTSYNNGSGTTSNTLAGSTIKLGNSLTPGAAFNTTTGTVEYVKATAQTVYSGVQSATYGTLIVRNGTTANAKTLDGSVTVSGAVTVDNTRLTVGGSNTLAVAGSGISGINGGDLKADDASATVNYTANAAQAVFPTTYTNLTLSGSSGTNTKSAAGNLTVNGTLAVSANDELDVTGGNSLSFGNGFTLNNSGNVKASGNVTFGTGPTITAAGTFTYYSSTVNQNVGAFAYNNLVFSGSTNRVFTGTTSVGGSYTVAGHTGGRDYRTSSVTFNYAGSGQTVVADNYYDLGFTGSGTSTLSGSGTAEARNVTVDASATLALSGTSTLNVGYASTPGAMVINGVGTVGAGTTLSVGRTGGTIFGSLTNNLTLNNSGDVKVYGNGTVTYKLVNAGTATLTNVTAGSTLSVNSADFENDGIITNNGTITVN